MKKTASILVVLLLSTAMSAQQEAQSADQDNRIKIGLMLFPNPTTGAIYIEHECAVTEVIVFNLLGQVVDEFETNRKHNYVLDLSELKNGMYFIRLTDEENSLYIQKVIKE